MQSPSREEILKQGFVEVRVNINGFLQRHKLIVEKQQTPNGAVPYLTLESRYYAPSTELLRIANEFQLPVRSKDGVFFPKGKMSKDFIGL
ncbi:MAG: hypothetical protein AABW86_03305 [Candidatus Micrarchaeota archaeon]